MSPPRSAKAETTMVTVAHEDADVFEDDGTLLLVRTATTHPTLLRLLNTIEEELPLANEVVRIINSVALSPGVEAEPAARAQRALDAQKSVIRILDVLQVKVEAVDSIDQAVARGEIRMARKALIVFVQHMQETLEKAKERVAAVVRLVGAAAPPSRSRASRWNEPSLEEKYRDMLDQSKVADAVTGTEPKPAWMVAREEREEAARERAMKRKEESGPKPMTVKFHGRGDNPPPSDNLYVKGLPGSITEEDIRAMFSTVGEIQSMKLKTADWGAIAFVRMKDKLEAADVIAKFNGKPPTSASSVVDDPHVGAPRLSDIGLRRLAKGSPVTVDLGKPLGIYFDDFLVAQDVGEESQAYKLGIRKRAKARSIGDMVLKERTEELVDKIQELKRDGVPSVIISFSPPPVEVVFDSRPFGFGVGLDEMADLFLVGDVGDSAQAKGLRSGLVLSSINGVALIGLRQVDMLECLKQAPLPVKLVFDVVPETGQQERPADTSNVVEVMDDVSNVKPAVPKVMDLDSEASHAVIQAQLSSTSDKDPAETVIIRDSAVADDVSSRATVQGAQVLERGALCMVDLSQPLGVYFDDGAVAQGVADGSQAKKLGICEGSRAHIIGDKKLEGGTAGIVERFTDLRAAEEQQVQVALALPSTVVTFDTRPLGFSFGLDEDVGVFTVGVVSEPTAQLGVRPGLALSSIGGKPLVGLDHEQVLSLLVEATLPLTVTFLPVPPVVTPPGKRTDRGIDEVEILEESVAKRPKPN